MDRFVINVLPGIIDAAESNWHANAKNQLGYDYGRIVRDYRTIRLSFGQRTGHADAISHLATDQDLVLSADDSIKAFDLPCPIFRPAQYTEVPRHLYRRIWILHASWLDLSLDMPTHDVTKILTEQLIDTSQIKDPADFPLFILLG